MREYLKTMRKNRNVSQKTVADAIGCYQSYYSEIENGVKQQDMAFSMMRRLAAAFQVPVQAIIDAEAAYMREQKDSA